MRELWKTAPNAFIRSCGRWAQKSVEVQAATAATAAAGGGAAVSVRRELVLGVA